MSTLDVEELLRRTYAEVAERTVGAPQGGDATIVPLAGGRVGPRRWTMLAAAAAVVALVAGGVAALRRDGAARPAGVDAATLVHVLPSGFPDDANGTLTMPLVRLESSAERDVIEYAGDGDRLRIQVDRGDAVRPVENPDTTIDGMPARLDVEFGLRRITWNPQPAVQVTVDWDRGDVPAVLRLADQLIFVDEAAWERATERAGFGPYSTTDRSSGVVATYRLATTVPVTVEIQGWIHSGFSIRFPDASVSIPNIRQQCTASPSLVGGFSNGRIAIVADTTGPAAVRRSDDGTAVTTVDVSVPIPGTDNFIEVVDLDIFLPEGTGWDCDVER